MHIHIYKQSFHEFLGHLMVMYVWLMKSITWLNLLMS